MNLAYFLSQYINQNANHRKKKKPYFVWAKIVVENCQKWQK